MVYGGLAGRYDWGVDMEKIVKIDGKDVGFKATALTPRLYRHKIGRDMIQDLQKLQTSYQKARENGEALTVGDLEIFENAAWIMARQYDANIPDNPDDWLDEFSTFSIYEILPSIWELWALNNATTAKPKKK